MLIKIYKRYFGEKIVQFTLVNKGWSLFSGLVTVLLISKFVSQQEQGFYFTFLSLVAIQALFELGLTYTVTQFIAHEMVGVTITLEKNMDGPQRSLLRMGMIFRGSLKFFVLASFTFVLVSLASGYYVFSESSGKEYEINWILPYLLLTLFTAVKLLVTWFEGVLEGIGDVSEVALARIKSSIGGSVSLWYFLWNDEGLFGLAIMTLVGVCVSILIYAKKYSTIACSLYQSHECAELFSWKQEVWPLQWRMAISWSCGYLTYQLFNPIIFKNLGPVEAGKYGLSLSIVNIVSSLSAAWIFPKLSIISSLVAKNNQYALREKFKTMLESSFLISSILSGAIIGLLKYMEYINFYVIDRLPNLNILIFLLFGVVISQPLSTIAIFVRAKKIDPYLWPSILTAIATILLLISLIQDFNLWAAVASNVAPILIIGYPVAYIFYKKYLHFK